MIEYEPAEIVPDNYENIKIDGRVVGKMWATNDHWSKESGFQCQFHVSQLLNMDTYAGTLNGSGKTKEDAIKDAIKTGVQDAVWLRLGIDKLERGLRK